MKRTRLVTLYEAMPTGRSDAEPAVMPRALFTSETVHMAAASDSGPADEPLMEAQVHVHEGRAAFEALENDWRALQARAGRTVQAFQSWEWCHAWVNHCLDERRGETPVIVTAERDGRVVLILPLMRSRRGPVRLLRWLSDPFLQYGDVLTELNGAALMQALRAAFALLRARGGCDLLRLRHVRADATIAPALRQLFTPAAWQDGAPWMDLTRFASEDDYEARYSREQRRRRRRIRKALRKALGADPAFETVRGSAREIREEVERLVAEKRLWLIRRGLYSRPLNTKGIAAFFASLPQMPEKDGKTGCRGDFGLVLTRMRADDRVISWELGFRYRGRHYAYITAHDHELNRLSPGRLHMDLSQREALRDGCVVFDLLVPVAPHKMSWSSDVEPVCDYYFPCTPFGRFVGGLYLRMVRPRLRRLYERLPAPLRRMVCRLEGSCQVS